MQTLFFIRFFFGLLHFHHSFCDRCVLKQRVFNIKLKIDPSSIIQVQDIIQDLVLLFLFVLLLLFLQKNLFVFT